MEATGALATARYGSTVRQASVGCGWTTATGAVPSSNPKLVHNATTSSICITRALAAGAKTVHVEDCWVVHPGLNDTLLWTSTISSPDVALWTTQLNGGLYFDPLAGGQLWAPWGHHSSSLSDPPPFSAGSHFIGKHKQPILVAGRQAHNIWYSLHKGWQPLLFGWICIFMTDGFCACRSTVDAKFRFWVCDDTRS